MNEIKSGIYQIKNLVNGHIYVGSAVDFRKRWSVHKCYLNKNKHHSPHLQNAWNLYGSEKFEFTELEVVSDVDILLEREQFYIDTLQPEYNVLSIAGNSLGYKHTEESIVKMSQQLQGKMSGKNHPMWGKRGVGTPMYGKHHTEDTKKQIAQSNIGKNAGENNAWYGKHLSEEHKQKLSSAKKGKKLSEGHKRKLSENHADFKGEKSPLFGKKMSEETKIKNSISHRGEKSKWAKLNVEEVIKIKQMLNKGLHPAEISRQFHVSISTIRDIKTERTWIDVIIDKEVM